ncbi:MAG: phosphopyruvate hydratase [Gammaproteobacteria bacterium]
MTAEPLAANSASGAAVADVRGREILDSRGYPTVEAEVRLACGISAFAAAPSGASAGSGEAPELRDNEARMQGRGTRRAAENLNNAISAALRGANVCAQEEIDGALRAAGGGENLGANALLAASLAAAKAAAAFCGMPLYRYLGGGSDGNLSGGSGGGLGGTSGGKTLPMPLMNILNGGAHARNNLDVQEFMIAPLDFPDFESALFAGAEVFHALGNILKKRGASDAVGDEGGFAPDLRGSEEALDLLTEAAQLAGYAPGKQIGLALDCAASELFDGKQYRMPGENFCGSAEEFVEKLAQWREQYPIVSIEDGCAEDDWEGWRMLTARLGDNTQLVGDDLFVTNCALLRRGVAEKAANALLAKPNQIGTLTETLRAVELARESGYAVILSHRSGETEYADLADLAVAWDAGQIKTGAPCRGERTAKYNRLLRIADDLGDSAAYLGGGALRGR